MFQIIPPAMPRRLYRYRSVKLPEHLERELVAIAEGSLWFSQLDKLNDADEGKFDLTPTVKRRKDHQKIEEEVRRKMRDMGICCFSDSHEIDLMWTHYANEHQGICVEYSTHDLSNRLKQGSETISAVRVQYDIQFPILGEKDIDDPTLAAAKAISSKKSDNYHEREWRLLACRKGKMCFELRNPDTDLNPVKGVYFGIRTQDHVINTVRCSLRGVKNDKIEFFKPARLDRRYGYRWDKF